MTFRYHFRERFKGKTQKELKAKTRKELLAQKEETKERKQQEQEADGETPVRIPAMENNSEYENFFNNTANYETSSGKEDPMDQHPTIPLHTEVKHTALKTQP